MLRVHFLSVGHGDCTIIEHHSGRLTMVDINTSREYDRASWWDLLAEQERKRPTNALAAFGGGSGLGAGPNQLLGGPGGAFNSLLAPPSAYDDAVAAARSEVADPVGFMQVRYPGRRLWRFVLTHPDLDHMRGLKQLYDTVGFDNFWDTAHSKEIPEFQSGGDKEDWKFYQWVRSGAAPGVNVRRYTRGDAFFAFGLGLPDWDNIEILSPTYDLLSRCDLGDKVNDMSIVLRLWHAGRSVLLPGDAEADAWGAMVEFYGHALKSDFLKASHHGRDSGYHLHAVQRIANAISW